MTPPDQISAPDAYQPLTPAEQLEDEASYAELGAGGALRGVEVAAIVLLGLLVCPPLAVLAVVVLIALLVVGLAFGLLFVLSTPYLLFHHFRGHGGGHGALLMHRLRRAGRAILDLLPHRIVADVRKINAGR